MLNPYAATLVESDHVGRASGSNWQTRLMVYYIAFELTFVASYTTLVCCNLGFAQTLSGLAESPIEILELLALGSGVWIPHGVLMLAGRLCPNRCAIMTPVVGAAAFSLAMLIFETACDALPREWSMRLSWTPMWVYLSLYVSFSVTVALVVDRFTADKTRSTV